MTPTQEKDTLIYLYEGLKEGDSSYMCWLLSSRGISDAFLKTSGIEDEWLRRGYRSGYAYQLRFGYIPGPDYRKEIIAEKKSVIAHILKERHGYVINEKKMN